MANTGVSFADSYEAVYSNPAALSRARQRGLYLGAHAAMYKLDLGGDAFPIEPARGTSIGVQLPIPFGGILRDRLVLGAAFYTPLNAIVRGTILYPDEPQFTVMDRAQAVAVQGGFGLNLDGWVDGLRVGAGFSVLASLIGNLSAQLEASGKFGSRVETQLITTYAPIIGVSYEHGPLAVGATWHQRLVAKFAIEATTQDLPVMLPKFTIKGLAQYDPSSLVVGASYRLDPSWLLTVEADWRLWSEFEGQQFKTSESSMQPPDPKFSDTVSPRLGVEYTFATSSGRAVVRGGYAYEPSPAPKARTEALFLDNDRHIFSAGAEFTLPMADGDDAPSLTTGAYGQLHIAPERTHSAVDEQGAHLKSSGVIVAAGWSLGVNW